MELLDRYIGKAVGLGIFVALLVIVTLDSLISFAGEVGVIGWAHYTTWQAVEFILLSAPQKLYSLFPMIAVLGTMLGLGTLASHNEITAMRAAGMSLLQLIFAVLKSALLITAVIIFIGEVIAPPAIQYAKLNRVRAMEAQISLNTDYGLWARDGNTYIHVRRVENDGRLTGINLYVFDEYHSLRDIYSAASGEFVNNAWQLNRVVHKKITAEGIIQTNEASMTWQTLLKPDMVNIVSVTPDNLALWKLHNYIEYMQDNGLDASNYQLTFWSKIIAPLTITAMMLLAVPFIFGTMRDVGVGQRVFVGFIIGLGYYILSQLIGRAGLVYNIPPVLAAIVPTLIVLGLGSVLITRLR
ncbi:MAG: LPS export ABC transporter permease LptG [Gammaproteobacteria bacterium]|nr:LPS export ABC transporter permease LptG [Gammaproteobacteria bacterium]